MDGVKLDIVDAKYLGRLPICAMTLEGKIGAGRAESSVDMIG